MVRGRRLRLSKTEKERTAVIENYNADTSTLEVALAMSLFSGGQLAGNRGEGTKETKDKSSAYLQRSLYGNLT